MKATINYQTVCDATSFEPSAGESFDVLKKGKTVSWIMYYGEKKKIENKYLDF